MTDRDDLLALVYGASLNSPKLQGINLIVYHDNVKNSCQIGLGNSKIFNNYKRIDCSNFEPARIVAIDLRARVYFLE